jgi:transcription initiation factor TFIIIB Brf1 subunit/transcription initiation factor TFIIB
MHTMNSLELAALEMITRSKYSEKTKRKALGIIKKAEYYNSLNWLDNDQAGLAAAALYVARVLERIELEMKPLSCVQKFRIFAE